MKFLAYGWSSQRSLPALRDQVDAALAAARHTGWDGLLAAQREYLDDFWAGADVELDGDAELQQAVRFALFHVLQAGARAEQRAIPAKGLTGPGYDGHTFWDTESFVLPVLTYTAPGCGRRRAALAPLDARPGARARRASSASRAPRSRGGRSAARSAPATGRRARPRSTSTPTSPTPSCATRPRRDDEAFEREVGARAARRDGAAVALARPPRRRRELPHRRRHRAGRVQRARRQQRLHEPDGAAEPAGRRRRRRAPPGGGRGARRRAARRSAAWRDGRRRRWSSRTTSASASTRSPRGSPSTQRWDFAGTPPEQYPLLLHFPYFDLYRKQVVKQADLVLALHVARRRVHGRAEGARLRLLRGAHRARLVAVGVRRRRSSRPRSATSTSPTTTSARRRSWTCTTSSTTRATACTSRRWRAPGSARSRASAACATTAGGSASRRGCPRRSSGSRSGSVFRGRRLAVEVTSPQATYQLLEGEPLEIAHHGDALPGLGGEPVSRPIPPLPAAHAAAPAAGPRAAPPLARGVKARGRGRPRPPESGCSVLSRRRSRRRRGPSEGSSATTGTAAGSRRRRRTR